MDTQREVETKLAIPAGFVAPHLVEVAGVDRVAVRTLRLRATYWDSEDRRLARGGLTLRHRVGEGRPRWTLKTAPAGRAGLDREEINAPGPGTRVPAELQDLVTARLRGAPLRPLAQVRTARTTTLLLDDQGTELAEVVDDEVTVLRDALVVDGWHELEVEERPGGRKVAKRVLATLRRAGATATDQVPKGVRAVAPEGGPDLPLPPKVVSGGDLVRASLARGLRAVVEQDLAVRRDATDGVHQMRVACRRLRSDLRTFSVLLADDRVDELRSELSWLADSLGGARDLEVMRGRVLRLAEQDPLAVLDAGPVDALLAAQEATDAAAALAALRSPRYLLLLQLLHDVAVAPQLSPAAAADADEVVPPLVRHAQRRLRRAVRALTADGPDHDWHRARIKAKRARYAAEAAAPVLGKPSKHAKRLQTLLGEHQDAVVAAERLLELARRHPDLAVLCGRLVERERAVVTAVRRSLLAER